MATFPAEIVDAVCAHMNDDHSEDSLRIVQAFAEPEATSAVMTGVDPEAGLWRATVAGTDVEVRVSWLAGTITDRGEIRREVVALHEQACAALGVVPPRH